MLIKFFDSNEPTQQRKLSFTSKFETFSRNRGMVDFAKKSVVLFFFSFIF